MASEKNDLIIYVRPGGVRPLGSEVIEFFSSSNIFLFSITWNSYCASFMVDEKKEYTVSYHRIFEDAIFRAFYVHNKLGYTIINELLDSSLFFKRIPSILHHLDEIIDVKICDMRWGDYRKILTEDSFAIISKNEKCENELMEKYFQKKKEIPLEPFQKKKEIHLEFFQYHFHRLNVHKDITLKEKSKIFFS